MKMRKRDLGSRTVMELARKIQSRDPDSARSLITEDLRFRDFFGCSSVVALIIWRKLEIASLVPENETIEYLMSTLLFIKLYTQKEARSIIIQVHDPKTYKKRIWSFVESIADLSGQVVSSLAILLFLTTENFHLFSFHYIVFENRFRYDIGNNCLITCDSTDF